LWRHTNAADRQELVRKLESDPGYGRKVGEHLTELLDRIEVHRKPAMLVTVFLAYLKGEVDIAMFHRLNRSIELLPLHELSELRKYSEAPEKDRDAPMPTLGSPVNATPPLAAALSHSLLVRKGKPRGIAIKYSSAGFGHLIRHKKRPTCFAACIKAPNSS